MGRISLYILVTALLGGGAANPTPHPQSDAAHVPPPAGADASGAVGENNDGTQASDAAVAEPAPTNRTDCEAAGGIWEDEAGCFGANADPADAGGQPGLQDGADGTDGELGPGDGAGDSQASNDAGPELAD